MAQPVNRQESTVESHSPSRPSLAASSQRAISTLTLLRDLGVLRGESTEPIAPPVSDFFGILHFSPLD
jgi:hypothetical protein